MQVKFSLQKELTAFCATMYSSDAIKMLVSELVLTRVFTFVSLCFNCSSETFKELCTVVTDVECRILGIKMKKDIYVVFM